MNDLEGKIGLIKDIKEFAVDKLGITPNPSFEKVGAVDFFHVLYASRPDKIESAIKNRFKNLIYEDQEECKKKEEFFNSRGYDVLKMTWEAIGKKDCPITSSMLESSKTRQSYLVLHENFHIHCKENNLSFNLAVEEAIADCFAYQGALIYFASNPSMISHIKRDFREWQEFYAFANRYIIRLEEAYKQSTRKGRRLLDDAKIEARKLFCDAISKEVKDRLNLPINNAYFLRLKSYAPMAIPVYEAFREMDPREYLTDREKLNAKLREIKQKNIHG
jgi:hypothetical protein